MAIIKGSVNQNDVGSENFRTRYTTTSTFKNEHFPKPSPTHPKCHFGAFHGVENNFLDFVMDEILGLQLVLDFYQT